jgi:hypothetical protein
MVGHQAVSEDSNVPASTILHEVAQEQQTIEIAIKDILLVISTLGDMLRNIVRDSANGATHRTCSAPTPANEALRLF